MSLIMHRCTDCGHPDYRRPVEGAGRRAVCDGSCSCRCTPGAPELAPTFDLAGQRVERVIKPGDKLYAGLTMCGCKACKALYAELTGAAA